VRVEEQILVSASPEDVWEVIEDFDQYDRLNNEITVHIRPKVTPKSKVSGPAITPKKPKRGSSPNKRHHHRSPSHHRKHGKGHPGE